MYRMVESSKVYLTKVTGVVSYLRGEFISLEYDIIKYSNYLM